MNAAAMRLSLPREREKLSKCRMYMVDINMTKPDEVAVVGGHGHAATGRRSRSTVESLENTRARGGGAGRARTKIEQGKLSVRQYMRLGYKGTVAYALSCPFDRASSLCPKMEWRDR
eukprot:scaffold2357_cov399-Prasinococcus_capsulatus_cf.AAC.25